MKNIMAVSPRKRLLLLALLLLCLASARGRSLRTAVGRGNGAEKVEGDGAFKAEEKGNVPNTAELMTMDYTPARKKPPIHN